MDSAASDADSASVEPTGNGVAQRRGDLRHDRTIMMVVATATIIAVDQLTKWWAVRALDNESVDLFWTLRFRLVFNTGAAFSLVEGLGPVLAIGAVLIAAALFWVGRVAPDRGTAIAFGSIAGGALGNLADRVFRDGEGFLGGAVVDFIDVQWWPVWNVADMAIVLGGVAIVILAGRGK